MLKILNRNNKIILILTLLLLYLSMTTVHANETQNKDNNNNQIISKTSNIPNQTTNKSITSETKSNIFVNKTIIKNY